MALLLGKANVAIDLIERLAGCFVEGRNPKLIEHKVRTLSGLRVFGLALGYEYVNAHERQRHDPVFGASLGNLQMQCRGDCAAPAGKSPLNCDAFVFLDHLELEG